MKQKEVVDLDWTAAIYMFHSKVQIKFLQQNQCLSFKKKLIILKKSLSELTEKVVSQIAKQNWATRQSGESPNKKSAEPRKWNWSAQKKEYSIQRTQGELGV